MARVTKKIIVINPSFEKRKLKARRRKNVVKKNTGPKPAITKLKQEGKTMAVKNPRRRKRRNPVASNPRRNPATNPGRSNPSNPWFFGRRKKRRSTRRRRNPAIGGAGGTGFVQIAIDGAAAAGSAIAANYVSNLILGWLTKPGEIPSRWMEYGIKAVVALGGGWAIGMASPRFGRDWAIGVIASVVTQMATENIPFLQNHPNQQRMKNFGAGGGFPGGFPPGAFPSGGALKPLSLNPPLEQQPVKTQVIEKVNGELVEVPVMGAYVNTDDFNAYTPYSPYPGKDTKYYISDPYYNGRDRVLYGADSGGAGYGSEAASTNRGAGNAYSY